MLPSYRPHMAGSPQLWPLPHSQRTHDVAHNALLQSNATRLDNRADHRPSVFDARPTFQGSGCYTARRSGQEACRFSCSSMYRFSEDFIRNKAPEGRENVAHGASRGAGTETHGSRSPGGAIEGCRPEVFRPSGAGRPVWVSFPRANALSYNQSPLRGE
jgi:hypothetical protein